MSLSRRAFTTGVLLLPFAAEAGGKKKAPVPQIPYSNSKCTKDQIAGRVHADVIVDLITGKVIHLSDTLKEDTLDTTIVHPASLTKIDSVMDFMDRIKAGLWTADTQIAVRTRANAKPLPFTIRDSILMVLNPSLNVFNDLAHAAGPDFLERMNARMHAMGMQHTRYLNATGNPDSPEIRQGHRTSVGDLLRSIRRFETEYAVPSVTKPLLGLDRISGIWEIAVGGIHRNRNTVTLLEDAAGKDAKPYPGVRSAKSGLTCNSGFISYVRYDDPLTARSFIVLTFGHPTALARDHHTGNLLDQNLPRMRGFAQDEAARMAVSEKIVMPEATVTLK